MKGDSLKIKKPESIKGLRHFLYTKIKTETTYFFFATFFTTFFAGPFIASLAAFATRNFKTVLAGIFIVAPVAGLRPILALRFIKTSLPKPGNVKPFLASL